MAEWLWARRQTQIELQHWWDAKGDGTLRLPDPMDATGFTGFTLAVPEPAAVAARYVGPASLMTPAVLVEQVSASQVSSIGCTQPFSLYYCTYLAGCHRYVGPPALHCFALLCIALRCDSQLCC